MMGREKENEKEERGVRFALQEQVALRARCTGDGNHELRNRFSPYRRALTIILLKTKD